MKFLLSFAVLLNVLLSINAQTPPCACNPGYWSRTIVAGENCNNIAAQYSMSVATLQAINNAMVCNSPTPGTCICVPDAIPNQVCSCGNGYMSRTIQRGESCWDFANYYGISVTSLQTTNPNLYCQALPVGQCLCVPTSIATGQSCLCGSGYVSRTVTQYDSCASIANYYGITTNQLAAINPIATCSPLLENSCLCVPTTISNPQYCTCGLGYVSRSIVSGDSCNNIASQYGITVNQLQSNNYYLNCNAPLLNSCICVPYAFSTPQVCSCGNGYTSRTVQPGETCTGIASQYALTAAQLQSINNNNNINNNNIYCPNLPINSCMCVPTTLATAQVCSCANGYWSRTVQQGETCTSIASQYAMTASQIQSVNPLAYCPNLPGNSCMCVPYSIPAQTCSCGTGYMSRTVQAGETCSSIANYYGINVNSLTTTNPNIYCANLPIGSCMCVPTSIATPQTCACGNGYYSRTIQSGETCTSIASYYGITTGQLTATNPIMSCSPLLANSCVCVPTTLATPQVCSCGIGYVSRTIAAGDSCSSLASYYQITQQQLVATNPSAYCPQLAIGSCMCVPTTLPNPQTCSCGLNMVSRTIRSTDSCASLATYYGISQSQLTTTNQNLYCASPLVNSCICVPVALPAPITCTCTNGYQSRTLTNTDTCNSLATTYYQNTQQSQANLQAVNPGLDCSQPLINSCVCVPIQPAPVTFPCNCGTATTRYVAPGETCASIAGNTGAAAANFYAVNPNLNCNNLAVGQCVCIPVAVAPAPCNCGTATTRYVAPGETCASFVGNTGAAAANFYAVNPNINCNNLAVGQCVCIPSAVAPAPVPVVNTCNYCSTGNYRTIVQGDTCDAIATRNGYSWQYLMTFNQGVNCGNLQIGQCICLPSAGAPAPAPVPVASTCARRVTIKSGDTCFNYAQFYQTTVTAILSRNPGLNCANLPVGSSICV